MVRFLVVLPVIFVAGTICLGPAPLSAQDVPPPNRGGFTLSMGIPSEWRWALGFSAGVHRRVGSEVAFYGTGGVYKDIMKVVSLRLCKRG